jgi:hypothetical protein
MHLVVALPQRNTPLLTSTLYPFMTVLQHISNSFTSIIRGRSLAPVEWEMMKGRGGSPGRVALGLWSPVGSAPFEPFSIDGVSQVSYMRYEYRHPVSRSSFPFPRTGVPHRGGTGFVRWGRLDREAIGVTNIGAHHEARAALYDLMAGAAYRWRGPPGTPREHREQPRRSG